MSQTTILTQTDIDNKLKRIAFQIYENNVHEKEIIIGGIDRKGFILAERITEILMKISPLKVKLCKVSINKKEPLSPVKTSLESSEYQNRSVVLIDDVLHTGTTLMYGVKHFLEVPLKQFQTGVLVDRNHKKYPIKVDFKGVSLSTSIQDHVKVVFSDKGDRAYLE